MVKKRTFRIESKRFRAITFISLYRRNKLYTPLEKKEKKIFLIGK